MKPPFCRSLSLTAVQRLASRNGVGEAALVAVIEFLPHLLLCQDTRAGLQQILVIAGQALAEPGVAPALVGNEQVCQFVITCPGVL